MKTAVLLSSMGGPDTLENVKPFLFRLFNDPAILTVPQPVRWGLAKLISSRREHEAQDIYRLIGGRSPITENTRAQAEALQRVLEEKGAYRCFIGMSYAPPFIDEALQQIREFSPDRLVVVPMYPQYSTTTTQSVIRDVEKGCRKNGLSCPIRFLRRFYENEGFIKALAKEIIEAKKNIHGREKLHILFSAHGLPEKIIRAGDTYQQECEETARILANAACLVKEEWTLCYQSRVGPLKWIGPPTEKCITEHAARAEAIIIVPIAFVCEHSETLVELGITYAEQATRSGAAAYTVVPTVGIKEAFIQGLAEEIHKINQETQ